MPKITPEKVATAQKRWGLGVIEIGETYQSGGDYAARARRHLDELYGYHVDTVAFKPTLASDIPFRATLEGALSYFVAGNSDYPEDHGFALKPWVAVRFDQETLIIQNESAQSMGHYYFTDTVGSETKVEFSFGYFLGPNGALLINLHHSSLPYGS
ncbi:MAG: hypothetical protein VYA34_13420 [Myxococcota bacterium]|nr:hypothetical protein [Myxococcota bacterium]